MKGLKIRAFGLAAVVVVIISAMIALGAVQSNSVADVKSAKVDSVNSTGATLSWSKVSSADGYMIYAKSVESSEYKLMDTVQGKSNTTVELKNLEQATQYDMCVSAYKSKKKGNVESETKATVNLCTLPAQMELTASSPDAGVMSLKWNKNDRAAGYQLQYVAGDDFGSAKTVDVAAKNSKKSIKKLKAKSTYSIRARAYLMQDADRLYGPWSKVSQVKIAERIKMPSNIDKSKPMIALTFDDGPGYNSASDDIVDVLEKYNAKATFFMVGVNAKDHPNNLKRKIKLGCQIGNHTYNHGSYGSNVTAEDISKASEVIYQACGQYPTAFRSTGGNTTSLMRTECKNENMPLYYWSLDTQDWKYRDVDHIYNAVMDNVSDGDIILMHEIYPTTAEAVKKMVPDLIKRGYQLVTCDELVAAKTGKNPQPGTQYLNATTIKNKTS